MSINMNDIIKRSIYRNSRYMFEFFMYAPSVESYKTQHMVNVNPILNFVKLNSGSHQEDYSTIKDRTFRITPRNIYSTVKFFNKILKWFYDKEYTDLFLYNDQEELVFNADYNKLYAVTSRAPSEQCMMKAIPAVIIHNEKRYEGINLFINKMDNILQLTRDEVELIMGLLKEFSFQGEVSQTLLALQFALTYNMRGGGYTRLNQKSPFD